MTAEQLKSQAFQIATLKSESYRITGLIFLLTALVPFTVVRSIALEHYSLLAAQLTVIAIAVGYEVFMLYSVKRAIARGSDLAGWRWYLNIFVESQEPTIAIYVAAVSGLMTPVQALVAPSLLVYFLFIILSTLRLKPLYSLLMGFFAALGYLSVAVYTLITADHAALENVPKGLFSLYALLIFVSGGVAAFVAKQIREHVVSALREAELQNQLDRVNHDLDIARSIQQGLLPIHPPGLNDFDIAGWNEPADETGGDYFDWQVLPDGRVAISLADATGHGIGPALVSVSCRAYARASLLADGRGDGVLGRLNSLLAEDLESNRFVTFAVIFLDPKLCSVKILSAGHGPILWYRHAADKMDTIEAQGIPLGMLEGFDYEGADEGPLGEGDFVALVTDGFFEWENPEGEDFGVARMEAVLRDSRDLPAEEMVEKLRAAVDVFCRGTKQMDDLTAVILKRKRTTSDNGSHLNKKNGDAEHQLQ